MVKEFEELKTESEYCLMCQIETDHWADQEFSEWKIKEVIGQVKKDAWNTAIKWCADNAKITRESTEHITGYLTTEVVVDKQSILNGLIE